MDFIFHLSLPIDIIMAIVILISLYITWPQLLLTSKISAMYLLFSYFNTVTAIELGYG